MFNKLTKNQKIILYFFMIISWLFVIPILLWIGIFIGYQMCKNEIKHEVETTLTTENEKDSNYLEVNI